MDFNLPSNIDKLRKYENKSLDKLTLEGKFIEASWYGDKKGQIKLGGNFHSKRLKINVIKL